jgi:hypothetical protein
MVERRVQLLRFLNQLQPRQLQSADTGMSKTLLNRLR